MLQGNKCLAAHGKKRNSWLFNENNDLDRKILYVSILSPRYFTFRPTTGCMKYPVKLDVYARAARPSLSSSMRDFSQSLSNTGRLHKAQIRGETAQIRRELTTQHPQLLGD